MLWQLGKLKEKPVLFKKTKKATLKYLFAPYIIDIVMCKWGFIAFIFLLLFGLVSAVGCEEKTGCVLTDDYFNAEFLIMGTIDENRFPETVCMSWNNCNFLREGDVSDVNGITWAELNAIMPFDDVNVSNTLTLDATSSVDWTALTNYPSACPIGQAVITIGDSLVCSPFQTGIERDTNWQTSYGVFDNNLEQVYWKQSDLNQLIDQNVQKEANPDWNSIGINIVAIHPLDILHQPTSNAGTDTALKITQSFVPTGANYSTHIEGLRIFSEVHSNTAVDSNEDAYIRAFTTEAYNFSDYNIHAVYGYSGVAGLGAGSTGSVNSAYGLHGYVNVAGSGVITNAFANFAEIRLTDSGTIETGVGYFVDASNTSGTLKNLIGFKMPDASGIANNQYGILTFGKSRFGDNNLPTYTVEVAGDMLIETDLNVLGESDFFGAVDIRTFGNTHFGYGSGLTSENYITWGEDGKTVFRTFDGTSYSHKFIMDYNAFFPNADSSVELGKDTKYWNNIFADKVTFNSTAWIDGSVAGKIEITGAVTIKSNNLTANKGTFNTGIFVDADAEGEGRIGRSSIQYWDIYGYSGGNVIKSVSSDANPKNAYFDIYPADKGFAWRFNGATTLWLNSSALYPASAYGALTLGKLGNGWGNTYLYGKIKEYNNVATEGAGVPFIVDRVGITGRTTNIAATNCTNTDVAGEYRVSWYIICTNSTGGSPPADDMDITISWNDGTQAQSLTTNVASFITGKYGEGRIFVRHDGSSNITYAVTHNGDATTTYSFYLICERLN